MEVDGLMALGLFAHCSPAENKKEKRDGSNVYRCQIRKPHGNTTVLNKDGLPVSHFILPSFAIAKSC